MRQVAPSKKDDMQLKALQKVLNGRFAPGEPTELLRFAQR